MVDVETTSARDDAAVAALLAVRGAVTPQLARTGEEYLELAALDGEAAIFVARRGGEVLGAAELMRRLDLPAELRLWGMALVPDAHRRAGVGSALFAAMSRQARRRGVDSLDSDTIDDDPAGLAFALHHGFREVARSKHVALALAGCAPPPIAAGNLVITTLAARPDLLQATYLVAHDAIADIPHGDPPSAAGTLDEWCSVWVDRTGIGRDAFFIALAGDEVVGFASLGISPARPTVARHRMTGVARGWRGRGVAGALKRHQVRWAMAAGLEALEADNDEGNDAMRAINRRLGYQPLPDWIELEGPLAAAG